MSPIESALAAMAISDGPSLVRAIVAAFGADGHAKVQAILDAEKAAIKASVDVLEEQAIAEEKAP